MRYLPIVQSTTASSEVTKCRTILTSAVGKFELGSELLGLCVHTAVLIMLW